MDALSLEPDGLRRRAEKLIERQEQPGRKYDQAVLRN